MKEFFGIGGYQRPAEGFLSWQHLLFVTSLMVIMVTCAVLLGKRNKAADLKTKNRVLIWAAFLIDGFELFKIFLLCYRSESFSPILHNLPLFLCSIQLLAIPMAAFSKGIIKEACLDFVCIFGIAGAILGIRLGEEALPDFYIECLEPAEVLRELADDMHTGCPMEMGNKLFDLDWDYKYLHGGT
jgi:hypothetical protein